MCNHVGVCILSSLSGIPYWDDASKIAYLGQLGEQERHWIIVNNKMGVKKCSYSPRARRHTSVVDWDNLQDRCQEKSPKKQPAEPRLSTGLSLHQCSWACPTKNILLHPVVTEHKQNLLKIILSSNIISPRRHESSYFLNRRFFFTRISLSSTRNQWTRFSKPHLFETAIQIGLRPRPHESG